MSSATYNGFIRENIIVFPPIGIAERAKWCDCT